MYKRQALGRLFSDLGFDDAISFARKYEGVRQFIETRLSSTETLESYLDLFVRTRNESSHGNISTIASAKQIIDYADFLCELFNAFAILLRSDILKRGTMTGQTQDVAEILHVYTGGIYGASARSNSKLTIGQRIYAGKKSISDATVLSLQIGRDSHSTLELKPGMEFGVSLDIPLKNGTHMYQWNP